MRKLLLLIGILASGLRVTAYSNYNQMKDTVPSAKEECEALLNYVLPFAEKFLQEQGEFFPFGAVMKTNREMVSVAGHDGREQPPSDDVIRILKEGFIEGAKNGSYRATALAYDVRITAPAGEKQDAIAIALDHPREYSVIVYFPYRMVDGILSIGEPMANNGTGGIFH
ncbi:MAG: hypothetical protein QM724_09265 [Flavobacteriales bacterium]